MPPSLAEYLALAFGVLMILGLTTCVAFLWAFCYFLILLFMRLPTFTKEVSPAETPAITPIPDAKKRELPGRSCGHCGVRIKGEPVRGIMLDGNSYHVFACPTCKKETILPVKLV
jgi:hypothetical protein